METTEYNLKTQSVEPQRAFYHWQNLNTKNDGTVGNGLLHGRAWWHFPGADPNAHYRTIGLCWNLGGSYCGVQLDIDDEDVTLMLALPPVALWLSLSTDWKWIARLVPRGPLNEHTYPGVIVIDERECGVRIHSGRLWINPWAKRNEWSKADPWWVRGISFNLNPLDWRFQKHEVRRADGSWQLVPDWKLGEPKPQTDPEMFILPYQYQLRNGGTQNRTATVIVERRMWRPLWLQWTSLFEKVRTNIDVEFSDEVGEKTGSWKGGCTGCSYDLRPGETPQKCLLRMQSERKF